MCSGGQVIAVRGGGGDSLAADDVDAAQGRVRAHTLRLLLLFQESALVHSPVWWNTGRVLQELDHTPLVSGGYLPSRGQFLGL